VDNVAALRQALLDWYDQHARVLPWRAPPGAAPGDPYRVWVSEVMLQQTTVAAVIPYFDRFMQRFPTVHALAEAPLEDVLRLWAGLGYYSRGRNLHAAARVLAASGWPADEAGWRALPGIGDYTAAAVAAIALGQPATVVDGNIERVMARLFAVREPLPSAKPELRGLAARFTAADRPGDFAQALMDLGATVCTPKSPRCGECPVRAGCKGFAAGDPASMPRKAAKPEKTMRHGVAFFLTRQDQLYLVRRPAKGLLGGMPALPSPPWRAKPVSGRSLLVGAPIETDWRAVGAISHVFTHFPLTLQVLVGRTDGSPQAEGWWAPLTGYDHGLPTVFLKAYERGLSALADQP
jgi:A/G-specific adenine glycosylase